MQHGQGHGRTWVWGGAQGLKVCWVHSIAAARAAVHLTPAASVSFQPYFQRNFHMCHHLRGWPGATREVLVRHKEIGTGRLAQGNWHKEIGTVCCIA